MKKNRSLFSCFIYSKEYSVASGHRAATRPAKTMDNPLIFRDRDRLLTNRTIGNASAGRFTSSPATIRLVATTMHSTYTVIYILFLKGIKGTTAPPSTGSSTATSIISGFIDEHLSFSLVRTYHPFSSVCLHLEQLLCNVVDKGNQASREHTQHNSQDSQQKDGNQHYGIRFLPDKAFS